MSKYLKLSASPLSWICILLSVLWCLRVEAQPVDYGVRLIAAPSWQTQSGPVTPQAIVHNDSGTRRPGNITFLIRNSVPPYNSIVNLPGGLPPRQDTQISFTSWTATPGAYVAHCSVYTTPDFNHYNDTLSRSFTVADSFDAQTQSILAPTGTVNRGASVTPRAMVRNGGIVPQTFFAKFTITDGYSDTQRVTNLAPGDTRTVGFTSWTANTNGVWTTKCSTHLAGDHNTTNDAVTGAVTVASHDVGCTKIIVPTGTVDSGMTVTPACSVYNYGSSTETITVRMKIGGTYNATATISSLPAGAHAYVTFTTWTAFVRGANAVSCSTELSGDMAPANDKTTATVFVNVHDVGATAINVPTGTVDSGATFTPACSLYNYGNVVEALQYNVLMRIGAGYSNTASEGFHVVGTYVYVTFPTWTATERGTNATACSTQLRRDGNRGNDKVTSSVSVAVHNIGAVAIVAPTGAIPPGTVTPQATVHNSGTAREACTVTFSINSSPPYRNTISLTAGLPFADTTLSFTNWSAIPGNCAARCSTYLTSDQVRANDTVTGAFTVQLPDTGGITIELRWDNGTTDLDLYLVDSLHDTICWCHRNGKHGGHLDVDDTKGYGPEKITHPISDSAYTAAEIIVSFYGPADGDVTSAQVRFSRRDSTQTTDWRKLPAPGYSWPVGTVNLKTGAWTIYPFKIQKRPSLSRRRK